MRIIAGTHRGRRIAAPEGRGTRPMLDRVREALFSTLAPRVPEARVLDLFAGSGSLGLEALSRGASAVRFVERDAKAARLILENVKLLGEEQRAWVQRGDALDPASFGEELFDVVFLDPPYALLLRRAFRAALFDTIRTFFAEGAAPGAVLVFHAPRGQLYPGEFAGLEAQARDYGSGTLWYVRASEPSAPRLE